MVRGDLIFCWTVFNFFYSLCEIKENPIGIQMILLEKKTILILFLNVWNRKTSKNSFKAAGKRRSLFPLNCTIVSVSIETDGIAVKCHQQTWASKYMQVCFQRHRKKHVYILAKEWSLNVCRTRIIAQNHMMVSWWN